MNNLAALKRAISLLGGSESTCKYPIFSVNMSKFIINKKINSRENKTDHIPEKTVTRTYILICIIVHFPLIVMASGILKLA